MFFWKCQSVLQSFLYWLTLEFFNLDNYPWRYGHFQLCSSLWPLFQRSFMCLSFFTIWPIVQTCRCEVCHGSNPGLIALWLAKLSIVGCRQSVEWRGTSLQPSAALWQCWAIFLFMSCMYEHVLTCCLQIRSWLIKYKLKLVDPVICRFELNIRGNSKFYIIRLL